MFWCKFNILSKMGNKDFQCLSLKGKVENVVLINYIAVGDFVCGHIFNRTLELEFFKSSDNLRISISNQNGIKKFHEIIQPVETLHIIINMHDWETDYYDVIMSDNKGIFIRGNFSLK